MEGLATVSPVGVFMGKLVFASTDTSNPGYLSILETRIGPDNFLYFPAMLASSVSTTEYCTVYQQADDTLRIQMSNLMWIALDPQLGNLILTATFANAAALRLAGSPWGQSWQVLADTGWQSVVYYPGTLRPVLTTTSAAEDQDTFTPTVITPSLASINENKSCPNADLSHVVLDGATVTGIDFTGANFSVASLRGTDMSGCILTGATMNQAVMSGVLFDGATLDQVDMTQATLAAPGWGAPVSAKGVILNGCHAVGVLLGGQDTPLDCTGAQLAGATFTQADLSGLILTGASLPNANLVACRFGKAVLDKADMTGVLAMDASFKGASLKNVRGHNANFVHADFSAADLGQAQMGAKSFLFSLPDTYAADLQEQFPDLALQTAFSQQGVTLSPQAQIEGLIAGKRWQIDDPAGPYLLRLNDVVIDVFLVASTLSPAILCHALCLGTKASGASLGGVDLRGAQWFGSGASLDHADLEGAALSNCLLASLDLTQAFLSGADMSNSVLVQARMAGCVINRGSSAQAFSLEGAQLQGCDFTDATLLSGLLVDAGVALVQGVPLFTLPPSALNDLTPSGVSSLAPKFLAAGYPVGSSPSITSVSIWNIDNSSDPTTSDPASYVVRLVQGQLNVFDGVSNVFYFVLPASDLPLLSGATASNQLIDLFSNAGYGLVPSALIGNGSYWKISPSADAGMVGPFGYANFRVVQQASGLQVFGSGSLLMRDWAQYPAGLAFTATNALPAALSSSCLGPNGYPASYAQSGVVSWQDLFTAAKR